MRRRSLLASAAAGALLPHRLLAQGTPKVARIGWVTAQQASSLAPYVEAFRSGLADLGYSKAAIWPSCCATETIILNACRNWLPS